MVERAGLASMPMTNYKTSNHIIAYLDMLGTKQLIYNDNDYEFLNHLNMFMEDSIEESGGGIFPNKEEIFVKIFSDNILLAIELKENDEKIKTKIMWMIKYFNSWFIKYEPRILNQQKILDKDIKKALE